MKVLYLAPNGNGGIAQLAREMVTSNFEDFDVRVLRTTKSLGKGVTNLPFSLIRFACICVFWRPDLLHINVGSKGSVVRKAVFFFVGKLLGQRVGVQFHSGKLPEYLEKGPRFSKFLMKYMVGSASVIFSHGHATSDWLESGYPLHAAKVRTLPNFSKEFEGASSKALHGSFQTIRLLYLGRIEKEKGLATLIEACKLLNERRINWQLTVAGLALDSDAGLVSELNNLSPSNVIVLPWNSQKVFIRDLIDQSHLLVLPSFYENAPLSIIEAFSRSRPVIASAVGSVPEMICHLRTGILLAPGDGVGLADAVQLLAQDPKLLTELSRFARETYLERFTPDYFSAVYTQALSDAVPRA